MEACPFTLVPHVKINPSYLVFYKQCVWHDLSKRKKKTNVVRPVSNKHEGLISEKAASRIKNAVSWLLYLATNKELPAGYHGKNFLFKIAFITLTLSSKQVHSDNVIKSKCLNQFFIEAKKKWGVKNYIWRAEAQINGNIHFHILVDKFVPWSELRDTWNRIQNKLGYVNEYRSEMKRFHAGGFKVREALLKKWAYKNQLHAYRVGSKNDFNSPNSTDVHSIKKVKNIFAYITKYCSKNTGGRNIDGGLWYLSESLSVLKGAVSIVDSAVSNDLELICRKYPECVHSHDYYSFINVSVQNLELIGCVCLYAIFKSYIYSSVNNIGDG